MIETFVALMAAHLLSDFVLQTDWMVANKRRSWVMMTHVAIVGVATAVAIGAHDAQAFIAMAVIVLSHLVIDFIKTKFADSLLAFTLDQAAHVAVVLGISIVIPDLAQQGLWSWLPGDAQAHYYVALVVGSGFIIAVPLGGILIKKLLAPFGQSPLVSNTATSAAASQINAIGHQPPPNVGRYIGWLERGLTFGFLLMKMPEAVGFLLAAKSVLRIGDLKDSQDRSQAEYIIIGTFMSFGWAFLIAIIAGAIITRWTA